MKKKKWRLTENEKEYIKVVAAPALSVPWLLAQSRPALPSSLGNLNLPRAVNSIFCSAFALLFSRSPQASHSMSELQFFGEDTLY